MSKKLNYKLLSKYILLNMQFTVIFLICLPSLYAQDAYFNETVQIIKGKVSCCSVPFAASTKRKVSSIDISRNGNVSLFYSDKKSKQTFNLFKLYKQDKDANGIDTILSGKFIQFYVSKEKIRLIRFATPKNAREVYTAFLRLLYIGNRENEAAHSLNFEDTKERINNMLGIWAEAGNIYRINALPNGNVAIINGRNQSFQLNLFDLRSNQNDDLRDNCGIEIITCDLKKQAPLAWINFYTKSNKAAFIRLECQTSKATLDSIRNAFIYLKFLCSKLNPVQSSSTTAVYFVNRNTVLQSRNRTLMKSIRSIDKKDEGDATFSIYSNAEGWLDKDSLPVGIWNFYSKNKAGEEYLFKSGSYQRTTPSIFEVVNMENSDLVRTYRTSYNTLQNKQASTIPFIKSNEWTYYHDNSKIWKTVKYKNSHVPIITNIVMNDLVNPTSTQLSITLKEELDEWIDGEVNEFDDNGNLCKKLEYQNTGEVYKKTLYNKNGSIIKTETAKHYQSTVSATNY